MVLPNVDIFPMDYYQNGSIIQVNGSVFCVNTSSTSLVTSPVFSKSSHVSTHVPNFLLMNRFCSLFLFLLDRYPPNDVQLLLSHHLETKFNTTIFSFNHNGLVFSNTTIVTNGFVSVDKDILVFK